jgi:hypothetical protein
MSAAPAHARASVVVLSTLVGSLRAARAVDDPALTEEILRDVRTTLRSGSVHRPA